MTALERLSERCGIQSISEDAFGNEHVTSEETKRKLLRAMRFAADTEEEAEASLQQMEADEWTTLPPVQVAYRTGDALEVPVVLDSTWREVRWTVTREDGRPISGTAPFQQLPYLAQRLSEAGDTLQRRMLLLDSDLPRGYHTLRIEGSDAVCSLIVTPGQCWIPPQAYDSRRVWGLATQLYLIRSAHNWGMGDFTDLEEIVKSCQRNGAGAVGVNPLHAMFPDEPEQASPYSPSDRLLLNVLYIDVERIPEFASSEEARRMAGSPEFQQRLESARQAELVDYTAVTALKMPLLRVLFSEFEKQKDEARHAAFEAFHAERRELLDRACLFQALRAHFTEGSPENSDCSHWPQGFASSTSPQVLGFAKEHPELIRFQMWLQWVADEQLRAARQAADGMTVGIYRDLAVGGHPSGAEVWSFPDALVSGASVGAPPDIWNPAGQNWGLPPMRPREARRFGYRNFIELLQANMRHAGALRIDHALALQRLYWIPSGEGPAEGAYVAYPTDDLIGIIALESHRNRCLVIGEDLGTVPKGFRERMAQANILSYRVLFFERDEVCFLPPEKYPSLSLSVASSHDLPTLRGWREGSDIDLKERLKLLPEEQGASKARTQREEDRSALIAALQQERLLDGDADPDLHTFVDAVHRFLRRTHSLLTLVQLDDVTAEEMQVNVPASPGEHPNWRRKLSQSLEELEESGALRRLAALMSRP